MSIFIINFAQSPSAVPEGSLNKILRWWRHLPVNFEAIIFSLIFPIKGYLGPCWQATSMPKASMVVTTASERQRHLAVFFVPLYISSCRRSSISRRFQNWYFSVDKGVCQKILSTCLMSVDSTKKWVAMVSIPSRSLRVKVRSWGVEHENTAA